MALPLFVVKGSVLFCKPNMIRVIPVPCTLCYTSIQI